MIDFLMKKLLFKIDPELAHNWGLRLIASGLVKTNIPVNDNWQCCAFGKTLPHPLGLAAGFDKNGVAIDEWENLGFSFVEVGTVTPKPQPGNPKPRLYRLTKEESLINRLGFNNAGIDFVKKQLESRQTKIPIGVNIGKNFDTQPSHAFRDYFECMKELKGLADYYVINISSPNTPNLRQLQNKESIRDIVLCVRQCAPCEKLYIKVSPDEHEQIYAGIVETAIENKIDGIVATNTTISRESLPDNFVKVEGGLSGKLLKIKANTVCNLIKKMAGNQLEIIGVGGIFTGSDVLERIASGANVCQIYTSFVFRGPNTVAKILNEIQQTKIKDEIKN